MFGTCIRTATRQRAQNNREEKTRNVEGGKETEEEKECEKTEETCPSVMPTLAMSHASIRENRSFEVRLAHKGAIGIAKPTLNDVSSGHGRCSERPGGS